MIKMPLGEIYQEQVGIFTRNSLGASRLRAYTPSDLSEYQNQKVLAIDIGGDKIRSAVFTAKGNKIQKIGEERVYSNSFGIGYIDFLEQEADHSQEHGLPVGISSAGVIQDNKLLMTANMPVFLRELHDEYDGSFAHLFPNLRVVENDSIMGLMAGAAEVKRKDSDASNTLFLINGSGIGGAVLKDGDIWSISPGHLPVIAQLNPFDQKDTCHNPANDYVCIEKVAAGKAGIEAMYAQKKGEKINGKEISKRAKEGDVLASELYDNSARIMVHAILGIIQSFDFDESKELAVVGHGGCFEAPGYAEKMKALTQAKRENTVFLFTKDFTENACLEGAAVAAFH